MDPSQIPSRTNLNPYQRSSHSTTFTEIEAAPDPVPEFDPLLFAALFNDTSSFTNADHPLDQHDLPKNPFQIPQQTSNPPSNLSWPDFEPGENFLNSLGGDQGLDIPFSLCDDLQTNNANLGAQNASAFKTLDSWNFDQSLFANDFGHHIPAFEDMPELFGLNDSFDSFSHTAQLVNLPSQNEQVQQFAVSIPSRFWELDLLPSSTLYQNRITPVGDTFNPTFRTAPSLLVEDQSSAELGPSGAGSTPSTDTSISMGAISSELKSSEPRASESIEHESAFSISRSNKPPRPLTFTLNITQPKTNTAKPPRHAYTLQSGSSQFHTGRVRKQFSKDRRKEIAVTRGVGACFQYRMHHVTCRPNEATGICSAIQSGPWQNDLDWSASNSITLTLCVPKIPGAPQMAITCRPFRPGLGDRVEDYVRGNVIGEKLISPTYAACDTQGLTKEIRSKARISGRAYVDAMGMSNASALVVQILRGAFTFANEHPRSILNSALDLWSCTRMNAYDRSLVSEETLGQEKVTDPASPFFNVVPIPPKLDYQCDMVGIKWQNDLAEFLIKELWKKLLKRNRDDWFEVFLVVFVLLNNVEFVYGIGKELSTQYGLHAEDGSRIRQALSTYLERWSWSAKHLLHVYKTYFKGRCPFFDSELVATARRSHPTGATRALIEYIFQKKGKFKQRAIYQNTPKVATTRDLHRLTEITTGSLIDDPTYDYLNPQRLEFPEDNSTWMRLRLEKHLYDKRSTFLVVELDQSETEGTVSALAGKGPASTIISYGIWVRMGKDAAARHRFREKNTWLNALDSLTAQASQWSINHKYKRRDASQPRLSAIAAETREVIKKYFSDSGDWWSLELLVTDREFRRRGAATKVLTWGTDQADLEDVFCGIESSPMGSRLYAANGFEKLATCVVQVPGEEEKLAYDVMRRESKKGGKERMKWV
ncbi:hypothetical protein EG329_002622 [Mollisiaceae sp. DMI_Dod_QoI]|nr:hypothetical protein EG329_002622 [Helotiales sp. DMI_Dod_QoI]